MGAYNPSTYIRATAAKLAREAYNDYDVVQAMNVGLWMELAQAQAMAMDRPYLAESYLRTARRTMRNIQAAAAASRSPGLHAQWRSNGQMDVS
jgi:hypothetical protein